MAYNQEADRTTVTVRSNDLILCKGSTPCHYISLFEGPLLDLKWSKIYNFTDYVYHKFSNDGSKIGIYEGDNSTLALINAQDGSIRAAT